MRLTKLIEALGVYAVLNGANDELDISLVVNDSRKARPGSIFVAIKGFKADGSKYTAQAVANGAVAVVHQEDAIPPPLRNRLDQSRRRLSRVRPCCSSASMETRRRPCA